MGNELLLLTAFCALAVTGVGCGADSDSNSDSNSAARAGVSGAPSLANGGRAAATGGASATDGTAAMGGSATSGGRAGAASAGTGSAPPPPTSDGQSVYARECHGNSQDCNLAAVPCFGVVPQAGAVANGWACANRCTSNADCSQAPSGAEAEPSCVSFTAAGHCLLVCQNENQSFTCPEGMTCHVPPKSALGYCLWP